MINVGGRPRKYDLDKEADDLIEWANKPTSLIMKTFAVPKEYTYEHMLAWVRERHNEKFSQCYAKAQSIVAARREEMVLKGELNQKYFDRFVVLYDRELRATEREISREKIQDELELKKAEGTLASEKEIAFNQAIVEGISKLQEARKSDCKNNKSE